MFLLLPPFPISLGDDAGIVSSIEACPFLFHHFTLHDSHLNDREPCEVQSLCSYLVLYISHIQSIVVGELDFGLYGEFTCMSFFLFLRRTHL